MSPGFGLVHALSVLSVLVSCSKPKLQAANADRCLDRTWSTSRPRSQRWSRQRRLAVSEPNSKNSKQRMEADGFASSIADIKPTQEALMEMQKSFAERLSEAQKVRVICCPSNNACSVAKAPSKNLKSRPKAQSLELADELISQPRNCKRLRAGSRANLCVCACCQVTLG